MDEIPALVARLRRDPVVSRASVAIKDETGGGEAPAAGYGLTDAEILQVLNHLPTSLVDTHLLIEDVEKRAPLNSEEKQLHLLKVISEYSGLSPEEGGGEDDAEGKDDTAPMEVGSGYNEGE